MMFNRSVFRIELVDSGETLHFEMVWELLRQVSILYVSYFAQGIMYYCGRYRFLQFSNL